MTDQSTSGERPTASLPRAKASDWKSWLALAALFVTPPGVSTAVLTVKLDGLQTAVKANTDASRTNTAAVNEIKLSMEAAKVTDRRLLAVEETGKDHETRLRTLEQH